MAEDIQLLRHYAETRTEKAFAALVERHISFVYSAALRQLGGARHRAEDVTQMVFVDLARNAATLSRREEIVGWLHTSTRYAAATLKRTEVRRQRREQEAHIMHEFSSESSASPEWERLRPVLDDALHELGEADRQAILLRFFRNERFADVGRKLGLSEDAARMRVERALDKLHALLVKRGITSTTAALTGALAKEATVTAPAGLAASVTSAAAAPAAGVAGSALAVFKFMSTTQFIGATAALVAVLALGTATYHVRAEREAESSLAVAKRDHDVRVAKLRDLESRARAAEGRVSELKSNVAAAEATAGNEAEAARAKAWDPVVQGKAFLQRHPEVKQAYVAWLDSMGAERYAEFYRSRGLTPAQIEQLTILMRSSWYFTRNLTGDRKRGDQKQGRLTIDGPQEHNERVAAYRAILGDDSYEAWLAYTKDAAANTRGAAKEQVRWVAAGLCFTETPLTPAQADQLTQIVFDGLRTTSVKRDWDAMDARARAVLSPAHLPAWESVSAVGRARRAVLLGGAPVPGTPIKR